ncbi:unnamed protein product [Cyclocybe aegerita]|uniref:Uncharacterized protein n=1 Tax=Cyclocybe aegerita TaxID=1973307 RepID=A0A8S0VSL6_CYCAE|nr:unnamed protein product [Cyclocybe aegerita]
MWAQTPLCPPPPSCPPPRPPPPSHPPSPSRPGWQRQAQDNNDRQHDNNNGHDDDKGKRYNNEGRRYNNDDGGQYALKFQDTVEDLPGDLEVLTTSIAKATDWMMSFMNAIMVTDFSRIHAPGDLDNFSLTSLLKAETSSKDEPTIHLAPVF